MTQKQTTKIYSKALKRCVLIGLSLVFLCLSIAPPSPARAQDDAIPNEFIFQVILPPNWQISEAVFAYERGGKYYLPINELGAGFDFFVDTETDRELATGFAGSEENSFTLDQQRGELIIGGKRQNLAGDSILISDFLATDDLYVQLEVLNEIWPVDMNIDLSTLKIIVQSDETLPFMRKKERAEKQKRVSSRKAEREERSKILPRRDNPYQFFGRPAVDFQAVYTYDDAEDKLTGSNIFTGVQQIGKMLAEFSSNFALNEDKKIERPDNIRFKLSRKSAGEEFLIPGIRSIETGDVNLRQRDLIANTESGRGLVVSNDNKDRFNEFSRITVEGIGPPGWDIELYNNEELIDFSTVPDNGQFFFEDVVLNFGNNQIKILLFGPQGQVREDVRSYSAGGNMLAPGKFIYKAGFLDASRQFILLDNDPRSEPRGIVKNLEASYGLNKWLTVFGNYAEIPENDKDHAYMTAGASISTPIGLVDLEAYNEIAGGQALSLDYITSFFGIRGNFGAALFNDFESQDAGFGDNHKTFETNAQLNKQVKLGTIPLGLRLNTTHTERKTGLPITTIDTAQTLSRSGIRVSHNTSTRLSDYAHETSTGGLTTTVREGPWQLRGSLNYDLYPKRDLSSFSSELRYRPESKFQGAVSVGHNFKTSDYNAGLQLGYDFDTVLGTIESRFEREQGWNFVLRATTSLSPYTADGGYGFSSQQKRDYSPVRAHVFLDKNMDGTFNDDDEPLPETRLRIGTAGSRIEADENGMILVNAPADRLTNFTIDTAALEDPYFVAAGPGFSAIPAKGSIIEAEFPIIETGAVEGTVTREDNNRIVAGLTLELFDANNEKISESVSAFDGYYAFEFIRPGTYSIRAASSHNVKLLDNRFTLEPNDLFIYGNDLLVEIKKVAQTPQTRNPNTYGPFMNTIETAAGGEASPEIHGPAQPFGPYQALPEKTAAVETPATFTTTIKNADFKPHNERARLVVKSDNDIRYEILKSDSPRDIQILINQALWTPAKAQTISHDGRRYTLNAQQTGTGTLLSISSDRPISLQRKLTLQNQTGGGARLLLDIN